jgi:serine/threonine-protein kinase
MRTVSEPTKGRNKSLRVPGSEEPFVEHNRRQAKVRREVRAGLFIAIAVGLILLIGVVLVIVVMVRRPALVPDVTTMTEVEATQALANVHLNVGEISHLATSSVGPGRVVAQRPGSGAKAVAGSQVDLTFAEQTESASAPNVVGLKQADAQARLRAAQFIPVTYEQYSDRVAAGVVVAQLPSAGTQYVTGEPIIVSVSLGPPSGTSSVVPTLKGKDDVTAAQILAAAKLTGFWLYNAASSQPQGLVLGQLPNAGVVVPAGSQVGLWVAGEPH